ncbi:MAG: bifunctional riboflavin kinase/FAD synthetase [bacterium]
MEIYWDINRVKKYKNSVLTVGTFDGVHLGHQFIFEELNKRAVKLDAQTTLVTFKPHPQLVLKSLNKPKIRILTTIEEKIDILKSLNINRVVVIQFTKEFSKTSSYDFVHKYLYQTIGFNEIVIGHDHAFGKNREGDIKTLRTLGSELGFNVDELPTFKVDNIVVSSTKIRNLLQEGKVSHASKLLGRNYFFSGKVVKGDGRGKSFNFPTANIKPASEDKLIPQDGVYAVYTNFAGHKYQGMMNIGLRPTFGSLKHTIELHIFDFNKNIYGEELIIEFVDKIRNEIHFSNSDELVEQLEYDKEKSLQLLQNDIGR